MAITVSIERGTGDRRKPVERLPDGAWKGREDDWLVLTVESEGLITAGLAGEPLRLLGVAQTPTGFLSRFELTLLSWAGRARVKLAAAGEVLGWVVLDVAPREDKLGQTAYREMLEELAEVSKDLPWGLSPADHGATRDTGSPPVVHPAVLEAEVPALLDTLRRICADPRIRIERPRMLAPLPRNREIDSGTFRWLVAHPRALFELQGEDEAYGGDPQKTFVQTRDRLRTWNHPANQALKYELARLLRALRSSREGLERRNEPRAKELAAWMVGCIHGLTSVLKTPMFRGVTAEPPGQTALLTLFDQPLYARAHKILHRLLSPGVRLSEEAALQASLRHSYDLFELLVLYRLWDRLRGALGPEWSWTFPPFPSGGVLAGPGNDARFRAHGPRGQELEIRFQRTFQSWPSGEGHEFWSLSGERRPDYLLLLRRAGEPAGWVLLDAKYRSSRHAVLEGMRDLHVYRDALRWHDARANAGFIIVPALQQDAQDFARHAYQRQHHFGVLSVDSADWPDRILGELGVDSGRVAEPLLAAAT